MRKNEYIECSFHAGKVESVTKHYHGWLELYYLQSGSGSCLIENTLFSLKSGDIMIIPPGLIHQNSYSSKTRTRLLINIAEHHYPDFVPAMLGGRYVFRNPKVNAEVFEIMKSIERECSKADAYSEKLLGGEIYRLFVMLARNENEYTEDIALSPCVKAALEFIDRNYNTDLSATTIAGEVFVSRSHLSRVFKKETGIELVKYITNVRMKHAEQLLKEGKKKSVTEIAQACGFTDSNYFSYVFKKTTGLSPLKYRSLNR